jgi:hypothetical protein
MNSEQVGSYGANLLEINDLYISNQVAMKVNSNKQEGSRCEPSYEKTMLQLQTLGVD